MKFFLLLHYNFSSFVFLPQIVKIHIISVSTFIAPHLKKKLSRILFPAQNFLQSTCEILRIKVSTHNSTQPTTIVILYDFQAKRVLKLTVNIITAKSHGDLELYTQLIFSPNVFRPIKNRK